MGRMRRCCHVKMQTLTEPRLLSDATRMHDVPTLNIGCEDSLFQRADLDLRWVGSPPHEV